MNEWQPIETAPRETKIITAAWNPDQTISTIQVGSLPPHYENGQYRDPVISGGFWVFHPTHWMPLPEPPPKQTRG